MSSLLLRRLEAHARSRPDALAIREVGESGEERQATWRQLRDASASLASQVRRRAVASPTVLVSSPNRIELLVAMLGGLWADACVMPVSPDLPRRELVATARRYGASLAIGEGEALAVLADTVAERIESDALTVGSRADACEPAQGDGGSLLLTTSGTTGAPRLVRRDAPALDAVGTACARTIGIDEADVMLAMVPLHHSYGIDQALLTAVVAGCAIELHRRFDPVRARLALLERGISILPAVPVMFDALARHSKLPIRVPRLRRAYSAGSPLPRRVFDQFERAFGVGIGQIYGATEFGSVTFNDPDGDDRDPEAAGRPMQGVQIRILDPRDPDPERPAASGSEGQLAVASPSMMSAYVGEARPPTERGFLLTGDLGRLDAAGRLRLTGRLRLLIDVGGIKVNPAEVESVLVRHPAVREAVVLAVPFSDTTARLRALVVPEPGCEVRPDELRRFAREHLIHYKVPRIIEIRTNMPRSPTGKILRKALESELGASS
jgi:acyl-CoA synthetase (AMP-forming)/AMP-acid ligase II